MLCLVPVVCPAAEAEQPSPPQEEGTTTTGDQPETAQPEEPLPPAPEAQTTPPQQPDEDTAFDRTHGFFSRLFSDPAVWFDSFFGDRRSEQEARSGTFIRWRNALRWNDHQGPAYVTDFNASVRLPRLQKKLHIFIAGEREQNATPIAPGDPTSPVVANLNMQNNTATGVLYDVFETLRSRLDIRAGVRFRAPVQPFVRLRYRYLYPLGSSWLSRFTQTVTWLTKDGLIETSQIDVERPLGPATFFRVSNAVTYAETESGLLWAPSVSVQHQLSPKDAISLDVSALVENRPHTVVRNFRIGSRYRRNFLRPWLFFELEPEIDWPLDDNGRRDDEVIITFLIEIQFETPR